MPSRHTATEHAANAVSKAKINMTRAFTLSRLREREGPSAQRWEGEGLRRIMRACPIVTLDVYV